MGDRTGIKYALAAIWTISESVRRLFPEYLGQDFTGKILSPYEMLPLFELDGRVVGVRDGTEAMTAYQAMLYGLESKSEEQRAEIKELLLRYCELDTAAMVMIWTHWKSSFNK